MAILNLIQRNLKWIRILQGVNKTITMCLLSWDINRKCKAPWGTWRHLTTPKWVNRGHHLIRNIISLIKVDQTWVESTISSSRWQLNSYQGKCLSTKCHKKHIEWWWRKSYCLSWRTWITKDASTMISFQDS